MTIVDSLANIQGKLDELRDIGAEDAPTVFGKLIKNSEAINRLEEQCEDWAEDVSGIAGLTTEIKALEVLAKSPKLKMLSEWGDLENGIHGYIESLGDLKDEINAIKRNLPPAVKRKTASKTKKSKTNMIDDYSFRAKATFDNAVQKLADALNDADIRLALVELRKLEAECRKKSEEITDKLRGGLKGGSDRTEIVERITEKKRKLGGLRAKQKRLTEAREKITELESERETLRRELNSTWSEVRKARQSVVDLINQSSADNVRAELNEAAERTKFRDNLEVIANNLLSASNKISSKQSQLDSVVEGITPDELIVLIGGQKVDTLVKQCGITENTAKILMGMGRGDLHLLETTLLDDKFVIKYQREGEDIFTPIDAGLSGGEQALALVSVAMIPKNLPLVVDQPEDELGTSLITNKLVEQIRGTKLKRQLIFVTHVANIPVLADSEQVIYMYHAYLDDRKAATAKYQGSLDNKEIIGCLMELDGGKLAFKKRSERYFTLMSSED